MSENVEKDSRESIEKKLDTSDKLVNGSKRKYIKPVLETEDLTSFGAVCNGTTSQRRKSSTGRPDRCRASRLNS